jgi:hypothetical protein
MFANASSHGLPLADGCGKLRDLHDVPTIRIRSQDRCENVSFGHVQNPSRHVVEEDEV